MSELTLYGDASWESPWAFHVMVALDELKLKYTLVPVRRPIADAMKDTLRAHAIIGLVPALAHGELWLTESSAITEYLAETFAPPQYPRIMPADIEQRARARQLMSWLRTSSMGLREDRPTSSVFMRPVTTPLTERGQRDADELLRIAAAVIPEGRSTIAAEFCMADVDLALMLMRLIASNDPVPPRIVDYAMAIWGRTSVLRYLAYIPTTH